jgi:hypothetical protein
VSVDTAPVPPQESLETREALARAARLSSSQVVLIEKIQKQAAPEVVAAVKSGTLSLNAAAAVATLPAEEQVEAAQGGKELLRQAAKRVREARKKTPNADATEHAGDSVDALKARIAALEAENAQLRAQLAAVAP